MGKDMQAGNRSLHKLWLVKLAVPPKPNRGPDPPPTPVAADLASDLGLGYHLELKSI